MQRFLPILLCLFSFSIVQAQFNDCADAEVICANDDIVFNPNGAGLDDFADPDNNEGCIVALESNSAWYYFEIDPTAPLGLQLGFTISPNGGMGEDYDWAVYGPDVDCGNLGDPLRCSSASAACDFCPETGVGMGAMDLTEGPGVGDGFTALIDVIPGQGFYLLIDNWAGTNNGFVMTWTGSAASYLNCNAQPPCALSADAGTDITDCEDGASFPLNGDSAGNNGGESYSWVGTNGGTAYLSNPNIANPTVTLPPGFTGTITYTLTVTEDACIGTDDVTVTINPLPSVSINPVGDFCASSTAVPLSASPPGGSWTGAPGGFFDPGSNGPGSHPVTYSYTDANGCTGSATINIQVNENPTVSINPDPATYCTDDGGVLLSAVPSGGGGGYSHVWTTPLGNTTGSTTMASSAGLYILVTTDANGCTASDNIDVTEFPNPLVTIIDPGNICASLLTYTLAGAPSGGVWSGPIIQPNGQLFPNLIGPGNFNVTYTYTDINGCSSSDNLNISIVAPPSSTPSNNGPYCAGETIELFGNTDAAGPNVTYTWTGPAGYSSTVQNPTDATAAGPYLLTVSVDGCDSELGLTTVDLTPAPDALATNDGPYCPGETIQLNGSTTTSGTTITYAWTGPNGYTSTEQNPTDATESGTYELIITVDGCLADATNTEVDFSDAPVATADNSGPYCVGDGIQLNGSTANTGTTVTYSWTGPNSYTSTEQNPTDASEAGIYILTIDIDGCSSEPVETEILINALPEPVIDGDGAQFCEGSSATLDAGGPYDSYIWSNGAETQATTVDGNGTYFVTVTDENGCEGIAQATVTEVQMPTIEIVGMPEFCAGTFEICYTNVGGGTPASYEWNNGTTGDSILVTAGGLYSVTVTTTDGCTATAAVQVEEIPNPVPSISGNDLFCEGGSSTLSVQDFESISWSTGGSGTSITVTNPGTYSVVVTNADGCTGEDSFTVSQDDNPAPVIDGTLEFCEGSSSTLSTGSYESYEWSDGTTGNSISVNVSGTYSVTVTTASGCTGETDVNITVNDNPEPNIGGSTSFCSGTSTTLDAGAGYNTYEWSDGSGGQTLDVDTEGTYIVTVTDGNGCTGEASVDVTESTSLNPVITGDFSFCAGDNTILDAGVGFNTYLWSDGSDGQTLDVNAPGDYAVTVSDNSGCTGETQVSVDENDLPTVLISGNDPICTGEEITLDAGAGYTSYIWSNGSLNQTLIVNSGGPYSVVVTDANDCTNTSSVDVVENPNPEPIIVGDESFCEGNSVTLTTGVFEEYLWSDNSTDPSLTVSDGNTYNLQVTDANGCTGSDEITITEFSLPEPSLTGDAEYCENSNTTISVNQSYDSYEWSTGATTQSIDINAPGLIDVLVTDENGCQASTSLMIIENPNPTPSIAGSATFCTGNSTILDAGTGFQFYAWSNGTANQTAEIDTEGNISVTVTDFNGCTGEASIMVTESQSLEPVIAGDLDICVGETSTLDAGAGFNTYLWSNGETSQAITVNNAQDYTVTVSDLQGCTGENTVSLVINDPPVVLITGPDQICSDETSTLDAGPGNNTYEWSNGETTQTITVATSDSYIVTITNEFGCTNEGAFDLVVNPVPEPVITGPSSFCTGNSVTLDAGAGTDFEYLWSTGETTQIIVVSDPGDIDVIVTSPEGCSGTDMITVVENASLTPEIAGVLEFCEGANTVLDAGSGYNTYEWSTGETTQTITISDGDSYSVVVTDIDGCSGSDNVFVTEFDNPDVIIAGSTTFCTGSSTTLDAGNYSNYLWSDGSSGQTLLVNTPGTYMVDVIDINGCAGQAMIEITESTSLNPVISGDLSFCENGTATLDAGAGFDTYLWSDGSDGQTLEVGVADDYSVTVSDGQGCTGETTVSILEVAPPTAALTLITELCNTEAGGSLINLYDLIVSGDDTGTWEDVDGSGAVGLFTNLNFNNIAAGDYNFIYTTNSATAPCPETSYPVIVTIVDCSCPDVQLLSPPNLCSGGAFLDLTTIENTTEDGTWTISDTPPGTNPAVINNDVFDADGADPGTYTLQYTLVNIQPPGCSDVFFAEIIVDEIVDAGTAIAGPSFCDSDLQNIDLTSLIVGADAGGNWSETSAIPSIGGAFDPVNGTFTTDGQLAGMYTFSYAIPSNGACPGDSETVQVQINAAPNTDAGNAIILDCINNNLALDATGSDSGAGFDIQWNGPGVVMDGNQNTLTPTVDASGIYILTITNNTTGCSSSDVVQVTDDFDNPSAFAGDDQTIDCNDNNVTLTASGDINPPFVITWTGPGIDVNNQNSPTPNVDQSGIYTMTILNPDNGCSTTDIVEVFEDITDPVLVIQSSLEAIDCNNPDVSLIADSPTPDVTYEWFNPQNDLIGTTASVDNIDMAGTYSVVITADNGCTATDAIEVVDNTEYPAAEAGLPDLIDCNDSEATLDGSASDAGINITYLWSGPGVSGPDDQQITMANLPGVYTLTVINTSNGCTSTDDVTIDASIDLPTVVVNNPEMLDCTIEEVSLDGTGSSTGNNFSYEWTDANGQIVASDLITQIQSPGLYTLSIINNENGCSNQATTLVEQNQDVPSLVNYEVFDPECFGDNNGFITINQVIGGTEPYQYSINGNTPTANPVFGNLPPGFYDLTILDDNGCELTTEVQIQEGSLLTLDLGGDQDLLLGDSTTISVNSNVLDVQIDTVIWFVDYIIDCSDSSCLDIGFVTFETTQVNATIIDENGCTASDEILVRVKKSRDVYIPNAFTPNEDGLNDYFEIFANETQIANIKTFRIFNRWGEVVHEDQNFLPGDIDARWDGRFKGEVLNPGVFIYLAEIEFIDGRVQIYKGDVTLIK